MQTIQYLYTKENKIFGELKYTATVFSDYSKHFHTHFGLALIEEGVLEITYGRENPVTLDNHSIALFNPRQIHRSQSINAQGYYVLFLDNQWCNTIQKDFFFHNTILNDPKYYRELKEIFHKILQMDVTSIGNELKLCITEIFLTYADRNVIKEKSLITQIKNVITTKYDESLSVEDIAKYLGYDKSYLIRRFKKEVGITPQQYILNEKVNRAKDLLTYSTLTNLSDISVHAGFFDQSHFNRNFKGLFGTTPKKYKKVNIVQDNTNDIRYD